MSQRIKSGAHNKWKFHNFVTIFPSKKLLNNTYQLFVVSHIFCHFSFAVLDKMKIAVFCYDFKKHQEPVFLHLLALISANR
jgi:hypothetical protein